MYLYVEGYFSEGSGVILGLGLVHHRATDHQVRHANDGIPEADSATVH